VRDLTAHATCSLEGELWCYERMQTHQKDGARAFPDAIGNTAFNYLLRRRKSSAFGRDIIMRDRQQRAAAAASASR